MAKNSILILGVGRSGTSSLGKGLAEQIGRYIPEPWRPLHPNYEHNSTTFLDDLGNETNIVLKTLLIQKPKYYKFQLKDFFIELVDMFGVDNTILIGRKNSEEHIISQINLKYRVDLLRRYSKEVGEGKYYLNKHKVTDSWRLQDIPKEYLQNKEIRNKVLTELKVQNDNLFKISEIFNKDIVWYEDLYSQDRNLSLNIIKSWKFNNFDIDCEQLNNYLDPKFKYNKTNNDKLI